MKYKVITISREYGTHGHELAAMLSEKLDIPFYDVDFVRKTAEESGFSKDMINDEGEKAHPYTRILEMLSPMSLNSSQDLIFKAQSRVILELSESPCIIVGRCANYILSEAGIPSLDVFLSASEEWRIEHAMDFSNIKKPVTRQDVKKQDSQRRNYYKMYTGREMGNADLYTLCLDVSEIDMEKCVDIICGIYQ